MRYCSGVFIVIILLVRLESVAQNGLVTEVVQAEKNFARYATAHSTRDAFVEFLSDSAIVFDQNRPVNGKALWVGRPSDKNGLLYWWPVYADVASDGMTGYTTGPWYVKSDRNQEEPNAFGYYTSMWRKEAEGWKVIFDIGIFLPNGLDSRDTTVNIPAETTTTSRSNKKKDLWLLDSLYNQELLKRKVSFLPERFHSESRIHRNGNPPYTSPSKFQLIKEDFEVERFQSLSKNLTTSSNLAHTYGIVVIKEKTGAEKVLKYLRIWKRINGEWKIVLDLLS